jgi:very-short-patch-repair endonuclease
LIERARRLRRDMSDAERLLWRHLRGRRLTRARFRRQEVVAGRYIADFVCLRHSLIIELDGGQQRTARQRTSTAPPSSNGMDSVFSASGTTTCCWTCTPC